MEYFLDNKGQIYGDFAFRLGKIICQYEQCIDNNHKENFISTLCISSLQSMLTIYVEFNRFNGYPCTRRNDYLNPKTFINYENYFGIKQNWVLKNEKFDRGGVSVFNFFNQLRNALSHPNEINSNKSTGYFSKSVDGIISSYVFSAYDVKNDKLFVVEVKTKELINLTKRLATFLAQPIIKKWDGELFNENLLIEYAA